MAVRCTLVLLVMVGVASPAPAQDTRIALWRLKPLGLDATTAGRLEMLLRAEIDRLLGYRLQAKQRTSALLAQPRNARLRQCGGETGCLCEIGKVLRVDKLVTGVIGALGDDYTFDLKLVDIGSCREQRRINEALSGREDLLIGAIRGALYKLVVPEQYVGSMRIEVPVEGAEVLVDGDPVGRTPLAAPITGLRPGTHRLKIGKPGVSDFEETVPVRFQQTTRVKVDLVTSALMGISYEKEDEQTAPSPATVTAEAPAGSGTARILAWSAVGLTGAAVLVGALCGWRAGVIENDLEQAAADGGLNASHQSDYDRGEALALWSNIGWGLAGGAAVLAVILFVVDADAGDASPARVSPAVGADGAGMVVRWSF